MFALLIVFHFIWELPDAWYKWFSTGTQAFWVVWYKDSGSCANLMFQEALASFLWVEGMSSVYCQEGGDVQVPPWHCWRKGMTCSHEESLGSTPYLQRCGAAFNRRARGEV